MATPRDPLHITPKRRKFAEAYLRHFVICRAALEAGYSERFAKDQAYKLIREPAVAAYINRRLSESAMAADEVLARLAEQAKADVGVFFKVVERVTDLPLPTQEIIEEWVESDGDGLEHHWYRVRAVVVDLDKVTDPRYSRLIERFGDSPKNGVTLKLYSAQDALAKIGQHLGLFKDLNLNVDMSRLSDDQLLRIANGESVLDVLASSATGGGDSGNAAPGEDADEDDNAV